jgi:hypothetical protein
MLTKTATIGQQEACQIFAKLASGLDEAISEVKAIA